ncbi:hypothetical protein ACN4EE_15865 [Geminocystis sp. CENA526]|uniref:hypothetical protein n=1 Tax=Geminocystis sp. CENA526 TaxID=1355871 RepID=UPI003D6E4DA4
MEKTLISSGTKQKITVTVDSNLIADIDNFSNNRSAVVEEALFLWRQQQLEAKLREFYLNRSQNVVADEDNWSDTTQDHAIANWTESKEDS